MIYIASGLALIIFIMIDIVQTTLTTKGEGLISSLVSKSFRQLASSITRKRYKIAEIVGPVSILAQGCIWLASLWTGWVLIFLGLPDAIEFSGNKNPVELHDFIYFVGFSLSTLGVGDISPKSATAQMATVFASVNGILVITLIATYSISVVGGVVARRVLAYKIFLVGEGNGEFIKKFSSTADFIKWVGDINKDLIFCTEQRLAYPILDNFVSKEKSFSLAIQLANLGLVCVQESTREKDNKNQQQEANHQSPREINEVLSVLFRYTSLSGITDDDLVTRLKKLGNREGLDSRLP